MMKIFRYILGALCLTLMSSHARSQVITAYDLSTDSAGPSYSGQQAFGGTVGMKFDVNASNITITSLGVFDSGGDGFHHVLTTYIFNADTHDILAQESFSGTTDATAGTLEGYHRFLPLATPLELGPGHYIVASWGFLGGGINDLNGEESLPGFVSDQFNSGGGVITSVGPSVYADAYLGAGAFPANTIGSSLAYNAGTFQFFVPEPGSVAMLFGMGSLGASLAWRKARRRLKK
jgi:hypothetical protein